MTKTPLSISIRPDYPDFLDLPWGESVARWSEVCPRVEHLPRGESRHPVEFISYEDTIYAFKELGPDGADKEYRLLRQMETLNLPTVLGIGHAETEVDGQRQSVLITRFLDHAIPYSTLFGLSNPTRYHEPLLDAMAGLLVQLHLSGVFWGDCSLFNTLFRRDAGQLQAYLVDAETAEIPPTLGDAMRQHELDIMVENIAGGFADLVEGRQLDREFPVFDTAASIQERYHRLWDEITSEVVIDTHERYRIHERIEALNKLGFSVGEVELSATDEGSRILLNVLVTDRTYHRNKILTLTGLVVEEMQARTLMTEIHEHRAKLEKERDRSVPMAVAGFDWLTKVYEPIVQQLEPLTNEEVQPVERYCQLLEHKWYLSEEAQSDVGHDAALEDFLENPPQP